LGLAKSYLAAGIDPKKSIIFLQSDLPEHTELTWILNSITSLGELQRMTQFKDKSKQHPESVNIGLLDYPVLMAADILLYKAERVPVGEDQVQHVELTRTIARKFNNAFGQTFPEPKTLLTEAKRIMSLTNPKEKMSKTGDAGIALTDSPEIIWKKLSTAMTDEARKRRTDPGDPAKCNIFNIAKELAPFREKYEELSKANGSPSGEDYVREILADGALRAKKIASETLTEVKKKLGLI
jgi:tryptophanyl-tRNA synthetase